VLVGAAVAVLALVGVGALTMRGGGSKPAPVAAQPATNPTPALGPVTAAPPEAVSNVTENAPAAQPVPDTSSQQQQAIAAERAKTAAAEAQLAAMRKTAAKTAPSPSPAASANAASSKTKGVATAAAPAAEGEVSAATLGAFNSTIDDARSQARDVMRSGHGQSVQLAKNYDQYLKTLKDSMRGIHTEKEAQKLLRQAQQTRAYVVFLQRQP
jgi:hypothetical protein